MWYRKGQALNIVGPLQPMPQPMPAPQAPVESPDLNENNDNPVVMPQPEGLIYPPVHDRCHCRIQTLPGGRSIWEASNNACADCLRARDEFNAAQHAVFGI